jgi:vitamin B12 transporter
MHQRTFCTPSLLSLALLASAPVATVAADAQRNSGTLEPILVTTATRTAMTVEEAVAPVTVITREDIEASPAVDAADLLNSHANIDVARNGGFGQTVSTFMRGGNSNHTLVLVDGVRIKPGTIALPALQNIDPAQIERIEVVRGPRSALYGSDAIGGVINVITRQPEEGLRWETGVGAGNEGARSARASLQGSEGRFRGALSVSRFQADGYPVVPQAEDDHGHRNTSVTARAGIELDALDLELSHWQAQGRTEYWDFADLSQDHHNQVTVLAGRYTASRNGFGHVQLSRAEDRIDQNEANFLGELDHARTTRAAVEWQHDQHFGNGQVFTAGLGWEQEDVDALSYGTLINERNEIRSGFVQQDFNSGNHRVIGAVRVTDHDAFSSHTTGNLDYGYRVSPDWRLTLGAGTAYRTPDNTDRFGFGGNPDLDPERSRSIEVGVRYQPGEYTRWRVSLFENRIRDLIVFDGDQMQNIDRARIRGLEVSVAHRRGPWLGRGELLWQDPRNETRDEWLPRRSRARAAFTLGYRHGATDYQGQLVAVGGRKDSSFNDDKLSAYGVVNASVNHRLNATWRLGGSVENLLDQNYETAGGFPARGRFVMVNLTAGGHTGGR